MGKRTAILDAAKQLFALGGFADVSMDRIANEAGVSKLTIYSHFGDKEALFSEALRLQCEEMLPDDLFQINLNDTVQDQLKVIGRTFFDVSSNDAALSVHRIMLGHGNADGSLKRIFWEAGPERIYEVFSQFLQGWIDNGALDIPDITRAASQFFSLIKGDLHSRLMCKLCEQPSDEEIDAHIEATVSFFLRAYAPRIASGDKART
jgi:TetR/AcrR family transcriptional repressor of mexJK operon